MKDIVIYIGSEPRTEIARKVLEHSIVKTTKSNVIFKKLYGDDQYDRGELGQGTGFSLLRFDIPRKMQYEGRAIYLDADMLVLSDIKSLWSYGDEDLKNPIWCKYGNEKGSLAETSVMVINCSAAKDKIWSQEQIADYLKDDKDREKYRYVMKLRYLNPKPKEISRWWNVMDKGCTLSKITDFSSDKVKLLHYTEVRKQPWFKPEHPYAYIWEKWFRSAYKNGIITLDEIKDACSKYDVSNPRRPNGLHKYWLSVIK